MTPFVGWPWSPPAMFLASSPNSSPLRNVAPHAVLPRVPLQLQYHPGQEVWAPEVGDHGPHAPSAPTMEISHIYPQPQGPPSGLSCPDGKKTHYIPSRPNRLMKLVDKKPIHPLASWRPILISGSNVLYFLVINISDESQQGWMRLLEKH